MRYSRIQTIYLFLFSFLLISGMTSPQTAEGLTSYIDGYNRFILNGEPFFPLGLYVAQCSTVDQYVQLDEIANSPFDTLMNYNINTCGVTHATPEQIDDYLDQLQDQLQIPPRNLNLIFSLVRIDLGFEGRPLDVITIEQKVNAFKGHPAIIGWYNNDEVDQLYLGELEAAYYKIKELDKNHAVWSVHWDIYSLLPEAHTTDVLGIDSFPIDHLPITEVSLVADAAAQVGAQTGKPFWLVPQIFDWSDCPWDPRAATGRPPTKAEMKAMTYLAVNRGAKGLIYYSFFNLWDDNTGDFTADGQITWNSIKEIAGEIDQLRPVFLSTYQTISNQITCNKDDIDFKLMWNDNKYYLFAVNTKEGSTDGVSFQINLARKPAVFDTMFEDGRQISVVNEKVTDDFNAYEVHVYRWEGDFEGASIGGGDGSSGGTCFIATAAFGSYVDPHVQVIKDFRDQCLLTNMPGRWFVGMYNTYGPFCANLLNAHPWCKPFVRLALMPVIGISYFALKTSLATKLLTGFLLMALVVICVLRIHSSSK